MLAVDADVVDVVAQRPIIFDHEQPMNSPPRVLGRLAELVCYLSHATHAG